jgi:16S rRNA (guanine527-N7)-methyltransferase
MNSLSSLQSFLEGLQNTPNVVRCIERFRRYSELLRQDASLYDLTALEHADFEQAHLIDSLSVLSYLSFIPGANLIDIGSGAGLPGIPLAICCPQISVTLLEPLQKRVTFLQKCVWELELKNTIVLEGRAEEFGRRQLRSTFDFASTRAVASLREVAELSAPLLKVGGLFIAYKGSQASEELKQAGSTLRALDLRTAFQLEFSLMTRDSDRKRTLFFFVKPSETPNRFPRSYKAIQSRPI